MKLDSNDVELIVKKVMQNIESLGLKPAATDAEKQVLNNSPTHTVGAGKLGLFDDMQEAVDAAFIAQKNFLKNFQVKDRQKIISAIRKVARENVEVMAKQIVEETKLGRYEDKILKNLLIIDKTPGPESLTTNAISGDHGLMIVEQAPYGLIGAVTPVTNPTETIINNVISMISGGNGVVFNVHPSAKKCCAFCVEMINKAIVESGGPENLVAMVKEPSLKTLDVLLESPKIRLMVGTGGMAMVRALLKSGKKVIGAGAGNPPVIVDETADIKRAAKEILKGASFDNNLLCLAEKEVFIVDSVADDLIYNMVSEGAFLLNNEQLEKIMDLVLTIDDKKEYHTSKQWVGRDAGLMLKNIGISGKEDVKLLICEVNADHPFVMLEQLMPVLPIVRCKNFDEAVHFAMVAERGNRHTASIFSTNVNNMTRFSREIETTIFVKNAATLAGVGFEGEGHTTMTIAGPTGEGITCPASFTRQRRCVLGDGGFRII